MKEKIKQYSHEVREGAVRMVVEHTGEHRWRWAADARRTHCMSGPSEGK